MAILSDDSSTEDTQRRDENGEQSAASSALSAPSEPEEKAAATSDRDSALPDACDSLENDDSDDSDVAMISVARACPVPWSLPAISERTREGTMLLLTGADSVDQLESSELLYVCGRRVLYELNPDTLSDQQALLRIFDLLECKVDAEELDDRKAKITVHSPCIWTPDGCDLGVTVHFVVQSFDEAEAWVRAFQASMDEAPQSSVSFSVAAAPDNSPTLPPTNDSSMKSGQLWVKSHGFLSKWRLMWFELRNNILQEFDMAGGSPHGNPVNCAPAVRIASAKKRSPLCRFEMASTDMFGAKVRLILGADSEYSTKSWMDAFAKSEKETTARESERLRKPGAISRTRSAIIPASDSALVFAGGVEMLSMSAMLHEVAPEQLSPSNMESLDASRDRANVLSDQADSRMRKRDSGSSTGTSTSYPERTGSQMRDTDDITMAPQLRALAQIGRQVRSSFRFVELHDSGVVVQPVNELDDRLKTLRVDAELVSKLKAKAIEVEDFDTARACKRELDSMQKIIAMLVRAIREAGGTGEASSNISLERMKELLDMELVEVRLSVSGLSGQKTIAIQAERYDEAGRIRDLELAVKARETELADLLGEIVAVQHMSELLSDLHDQKQAASALSDFETALDIKLKEEQLAVDFEQRKDEINVQFAKLEPSFTVSVKDDADSAHDVLVAPKSGGRLRSASVTDSRLSTYLGWPLRKPAPSALARAGFVFSPNAAHPDRVVCSACSVEVFGWMSSDDPFLIHSHQSPDCAMVTESNSRSLAPTGVDFPSADRIMDLIEELGEISRQFSIHGQIANVLSRPVEQTPVGGDLPRLAPAMSITSTLGRQLAGENCFDLSNSSHVQRVIILTALGLEGEERAKAVLSEYTSHIPPLLHNESIPRGISSLLQSSVLGEDCPTTRILKGCTQAAIAPAVISLTQNVMLKDATASFKDGDSWRLFLCMHHDPESGKPICAVLTHIKRQVHLTREAGAHPKFSFVWRLAMTFTAAGELRHVDFGLEELEFAAEASSEFRATVKLLLAAHFESSSAPLTRDYFRSGFSRRSPAEEVQLLSLTDDEAKAHRDAPSAAITQPTVTNDDARPALPRRLKLAARSTNSDLSNRNSPAGQSSSFLGSRLSSINLRWGATRSKK